MGLIKKKEDIMQREIKFRGKDVYYGNWLYGDFIKFYGSFSIHTHEREPEAWSIFTVHEETIGQFTGKYDMNDKEIYEDDIVKNWINEENYDLGVVMWFDLGYVMSYDGTKDFITEMPNEKTLEVVSNIHEAPELIE